MASDDIIRLPAAMTSYGCRRCLFCPPALSVVLMNWPSETLLPCYRHQLSGRSMYIANACVQFPPYLAIDGSDWSFCFFFICIFWLRWGDWNMKICFFFSRLPIRTIRNQFVNKLLLFSSITESHWSHWSVLETTDWEKDEWVQCFPLCSVTTH